MFVCICNALRDCDFAAAIESLDSIETAEALYRHLGCEVQCGRCLDEVRAQLDQGAVPAAAE